MKKMGIYVGWHYRLFFGLIVMLQSIIINNYFNADNYLQSHPVHKNRFTFLLFQDQEQQFKCNFLCNQSI